MKKNFFLRSIAFLFFLLWILNIFSVTSFAEDERFPDTSDATAVLLYNINSDKIIFSKNSDQKIFPGSVAKMMCGMVFCETFHDRLEDSVTITNDMIKNAEGAKIKLSAGDIVTYKDLLYGVICGGGNDACYALAVACAGSVREYVQIMNDTASEWGLEDTFFTNPSGYDDANMFTTASDVLALAQRSYQNALYLEASSSLSYTIKPQNADKEIKIFNRNSLISSYYASGYQNKHAYGLIAGFTDLGQYTAITYLKKGETEFICAVLGAKESADSKEILSYKYVNEISEYAFENYQFKKVFDANKYICTLDVDFALPQANEDRATVDCYSKSDVYALINLAASVEDDIVFGYYLHSDHIEAPVQKGCVVGGVDIFYKGELIGSTKLIAGEDIAENSILFTLNSMKKFFLGRLFIISIVFFVILFTAYLFLKTNKRTKSPYKRKAKRKKTP